MCLTAWATADSGWEGFESKTAIHAYNTTTNTWEVISHMATPRHQSLVAVLPHNEIMVVGGDTLAGGGDDSVEIATTV